MSLLFTIITITSIWTLGLTIASQPQMVLAKFKEAMEGRKLSEPIITCVWCMPSLHSFIAYGFAVGMGLIKYFSLHLVFMWPLVVCGASVLNGVVWSTIQLLLKKIEYYDNMPTEDPNFEEDVNIKEPNESYFKRN